MCIGICPKCGEMKKLTKHHVLPKRHFGNGKKNPERLLICRECHDDLERLIPFERQPVPFYKEVVALFLST